MDDKWKNGTLHFVNHWLLNHYCRLLSIENKETNMAADKKRNLSSDVLCVGCENVGPNTEGTCQFVDTRYARYQICSYICATVWNLSRNPQKSERDWASIRRTRNLLCICLCGVPKPQGACSKNHITSLVIYQGNKGRRSHLHPYVRVTYAFLYMRKYM